MYLHLAHPASALPFLIPKAQNSVCNVWARGSFPFLFYVKRGVPNLSCSLSVSPDWPAVEWPACCELVSFHVVKSLAANGVVICCRRATLVLMNA